MWCWSINFVPKIRGSIPYFMKENFTLIVCISGSLHCASLDILCKTFLLKEMAVKVMTSSVVQRPWFPFSRLVVASVEVSRVKQLNLWVLWIVYRHVVECMGKPLLSFFQHGEMKRWSDVSIHEFWISEDRYNNISFDTDDLEHRRELSGLSYHTEESRHEVVQL